MNGEVIQYNLDKMKGHRGLAKYLRYNKVSLCRGSFPYTAISRKVVGKNVHGTIAKGNKGYDQYTVPDTIAVEPTSVAFLQRSQTYVHGL